MCKGLYKYQLLSVCSLKPSAGWYLRSYTLYNDTKCKVPLGPAAHSESPPLTEDIGQVGGVERIQRRRTGPCRFSVFLLSQKEAGFLGLAHLPTSQMTGSL